MSHSFLDFRKLTPNPELITTITTYIITHVPLYIIGATAFSIGANGPRFAGMVPILGALSPLTYKHFYCGPRFYRLWHVFKNLLVLLIFDSTQNQLS